jgi:hypothetical protein
LASIFTELRKYALSFINQVLIKADKTPVLKTRNVRKLLAEEVQQTCSGITRRALSSLP